MAKNNGRQAVEFGNGGTLVYRAKNVGANGDGGYVIVAVENGTAKIVANVEKVIVKDTDGHTFSGGMFSATCDGAKIVARTMHDVMLKIAAKLTAKK